MQKKGEPKVKVKEFIENNPIKRPEKDYIVNINFGEPSDISIPILNIQNVTFGYNDNKIILENIDFGIDLKSRVTIVGPNGAGKSTFINLIVGNLKPKIGYISKRNHKDLSNKIMDAIENINSNKFEINLKYLKEKYSWENFYKMFIESIKISILSFFTRINHWTKHWLRQANQTYSYLLFIYFILFIS